MRRIGWLPSEPLGACVCRGDLGSDNSAETSNETRNAQVALNNGGIGVSSSTFADSPITIKTADPEVAEKGLDVANQVANYSQANVTYALSQMREIQERALVAVERATEGALQSAPVSPGAYAEATAGQTKSLLMTTVAGGLVLFLVLKYASKK